MHLRGGSKNFRRRLVDEEHRRRELRERSGVMHPKEIQILPRL